MNAAAAEPPLFIPLTLDPAAIAARPAGVSIAETGGATMGTRWSLRFAAPRVGAGQAHSIVEEACDLVVAQMSHWEDGSAISRFNRAPAGSWQVLPPHFLHVLTTALDVAKDSDGAFDPTIGALADLWGFGPSAPKVLPPSSDAIAAARAGAGWRRLAVDRHAQRALQFGTSLDLAGIAKGYAVDLAAERLLAANIRHFLLEIGGELRGHGVRPDGMPWWVDVERCTGTLGVAGRVALHGLSLATSGDYRRYFEVDGRRFAHSIDPRTGQPAENGIGAVSVLHPSCMLADAFATAIAIMGVDEGLLFADRRGIAAMIQLGTPGDHRLLLSPSLRAMLA